MVGIPREPGPGERCGGWTMLAWPLPHPRAGDCCRDVKAPGAAARAWFAQTALQCIRSSHGGKGGEKFLTELIKELLSVAKTHLEIQTLWEKPVLHLVGVRPE